MKYEDIQHIREVQCEAIKIISCIIADIGECVRYNQDFSKECSSYSSEAILEVEKWAKRNKLTVFYPSADSNCEITISF